jgi:hypothetical protein
VAFILLTIAFAWIASRNHHVLELVAEEKHLEIDKLKGELARFQEDNEQFIAENADLREALQEAQACVKLLEMSTVEMPTIEPSKPKRSRGKKEVQP